MRAANAINKRRYPLNFDTKSRLYRIWRAMHHRCYSRSHAAFSRYHDRGITICDEWRGRGNYPNFMQWALSYGYRDDLQIDRIDNAAGYSPENCRWTTAVVNQRNRINNLPPALAFGEAKMLREWAEDSRCRVNYRTLWRRVNDLNWPLEKAIVTALRTTQRRAP